MRIFDVLRKEAIKVQLESQDKEGIIEELLDVLVGLGIVEDKGEALHALLEREKMGSTGIGGGVALPHAKINCAKELVAAFGKKEEGVDFDSLDGEPAYLFFLVLSSPALAGPHLQFLSRLSRLLRHEDIRQRLREAKTREEIIKIIEEEDEDIC